MVGKRGSAVRYVNGLATTIAKIATHMISKDRE